MRHTPTAEALYDSGNQELWMEYPDSRRVSLGRAGNSGLAYERLRTLGLLRAGSWITMHGRLKSCLVAVPDGWTPPGPIS